MSFRLLLSSEDPALVATLSRQALAVGERLLFASSANTLDQARMLAPDLLIIDIAQRIDGRLLIARLKQDRNTAQVRIAALAAREDEKVHRFCREHRVASYSLKPVMPSYLERELSPLREQRGFTSAAR